MKLPFCDFGILATAILVALTVVVSAPTQPASSGAPNLLTATRLHR
ncbi:MAG: hypothetical protein KME07_13355 [Pegethrix bostrychoides GSE-TBD4-15B]|uniref:Uncharacterized protein n=1 Tax=Pegethrix bostrychoides GSE-TBD4-15B TaxID=2839662 RepID=A0A951PBZ9_9CYAN|nr:hypothetical protein [Pegethrix bostrychoides GSE-TBD4-15B]